MQVERIDPEEAQRLLETGEGYHYVDVRSQEEFAAGHVPGAVNVPLLDRNPNGPGLVPNPGFLDAMKAQFPVDSKLIVGCLRGGRSMKAVQALQHEGYSNVVDMRGGYDAELDQAGNVTFPGWVRRGLPTTTD